MITFRILSHTSTLTLCLLLSPTCVAGESLKQQFVKENGFIPKDGYVPKSGFVPDELTAVNIGLAVLVPIYGRQPIESQKPFKAALVGDIWVVSGTMTSKSVGGLAEIDISKRTGKILRVTHGK